jgi:NTP pyrophosphatase (non-canonical NTP hydrolase)
VSRPVKEGVNPVSHNVDINKHPLASPNLIVARLISNITEWHYDRNLIDGSTDKDQFLKLVQEAGELSDNICKGKNIVDDIGDIMVVLINLAERNGLTVQECLAHAYNDIKDRKGKMVDGVFVKEADNA